MQERTPKFETAVQTPPGAGHLCVSAQDFAERLQSAQSLDDAWDTICEAYSAYGIDHLIYIYMRPTAPHDNGLVLSNLPEWWKDYYVDEKLARHDPFFKICDTFSPTRTGPAYIDDNAHRLTKEEIRFIREGGEAGFESGICSPVRLQGPEHFGGWNLGSSMKRPDFEKQLRESCERLQLMGFIAHEHLQQLANSARSGIAHETLSSRERECLLWLARGLRNREIADRLNIAAVTVELHLKHARSKLGAATREEALAKAIVSGQIVP